MRRFVPLAVNNALWALHEQDEVRVIDRTIGVEV